MEDYYKTLGVSRSADQKEIRQAFRRLARQHHPDVNPGDAGAEERFKRISEAYETLSKPESRRKYDGGGMDAPRGGGGARTRTTYRPPRGGGRRTTTPTPTLEDLMADMQDNFREFEDILGGNFGMGGGSDGVGASARATVEENVSVTLEEAYRGVPFELTLTSGGRERRLEVDIPPGVDNGSKVRVSPDADLSIVLNVSVAAHARYRRAGDDLHADADIPFEDAILGGDAPVTTIDGRRIRVTIPPNTQTGQKIRLRGQGMPKLGSPSTKGDMYVTVKPQMPESLTDEQRDLLVRFRQTRTAAG